MKTPPSPDTPENWGAASRSYADEVAPRMMEAYANEFADRLEVDDFDVMWGMLTSGAPPVQMLFDRVGRQGKGKVRDTLAGIIEQRFGSGPIHLTNVATVGSGHVCLAEPPDTNARF